MNRVLGSAFQIIVIQGLMGQDSSMLSLRVIDSVVNGDCIPSRGMAVIEANLYIHKRTHVSQVIMILT
jgi:hypothetical protein